LAKSCCFEPPLKLVEILARKMGQPTEVQQAKKSMDNPPTANSFFAR
jgi:hypothetical protein